MGHAALRGIFSTLEIFLCTLKIHVAVMFNCNFKQKVTVKHVLADSEVPLLKA